MGIYLENLKIKIKLIAFLETTVASKLKTNKRKNVVS